MASLKDKHGQRRRQRWLISGLMLGIMLMALVVTIVLIGRSKDDLPRNVRFDPDKVVRLLSVSRVYVIRRNPLDSSEVWFGTAEGIRVLDLKTVSWMRYGIDHGLRSETIADIAFAGDTAWVATWDGISRFDRQSGRFRTYGTVRGLGGTRILSVAHVPGHGIFFYLDGKGLHRMTDSDSVPVRIPIPGLANAARITCLIARDSVLHIGAEQGRLFSYNPADSSFAEAAFERELSPTTFIWDLLWHAGRIFVATSNEGVWSTASLSDTLRNVKGFPAKGAYVFAEEPDGMWCGTPFGLFRYHDDGEAWIHFVHPDEKEPTDFQVFSLARAGDRLWYGSMELGAGFLALPNLDWHDLRSGLTNPNIDAVAADSETVWLGFGYQGGHIDRVRAPTVQFDRNYSSRDSIFDSHIQTLTLLDNRLYYGGYRGFGYIGMGGRGERLFFDADSSMPFGDVKDILPLDSTRLALAALFGILEYRTDERAFTIMPGIAEKRVTCLHRRGDTLWFGTLAHGLYTYDLSAGVESAVGLNARDAIVGVASLPDGRVFVAAKRAGCFTVEPATMRIEQVTIPRRLFPSEAGAFERDIMAMRLIDGRVWLGTREAGCTIFCPGDDDWVSVSYYDGLPSDEVRALGESDRHVWVGCYGGLCRFDKQYLTEAYFADEAGTP